MTNDELIRLRAMQHCQRIIELAGEKEVRRDEICYHALSLKGIVKDAEIIDCLRNDQTEVKP